MDGCAVDGCGGRLYCSGLCSRHYNRLRITGTTADSPKARLPFEQRVWRKIEKRGPDECWPWTAKSLTNGYGRINRGGRNGAMLLAHRAVLELINGPIPKGDGAHGTVVMHTCDNRLCCNPAHLRLGTQSENVRDMHAKMRWGRTEWAKGEAHHNAKLTPEIVRYIRTSTKSGTELARELGLNRHTPSDIRRRKIWAHVT